MRWLRWLSLACVGVLFWGCATTAKYEQMLATWVGSSELDLYRTWGPPDNQHEVSGSKFVSFTRNAQMWVPGTAPSYQAIVTGNSAFTQAVGGSPAYNISLTCQTTFEIRQEKVVGSRWQGNNCTAK
jgi:hypothetical protein